MFYCIMRQANDNVSRDDVSKQFELFGEPRDVTDRLKMPEHDITLVSRNTPEIWNS